MIKLKIWFVLKKDQEKPGEVGQPLLTWKTSFSKSNSMAAPIPSKEAVSSLAMKYLCQGDDDKGLLYFRAEGTDN